MTSPYSGQRTIPTRDFIQTNVLRHVGAFGAFGALGF